MGCNLVINGVYWGYRPLTNHLLTSWDIQVLFTVYYTSLPETEAQVAPRNCTQKVAPEDDAGTVPWPAGLIMGEIPDS